MSEVYVVVGVSGVGKSTVVNEALKTVSGIEIVNFGDAILEEALREKLVEDRDQLRLLETEVQRRLQVAVAKKIGQMKGKILVDTHLTIPTPDGYIPGLPSDVLEELKPKRIVIIEASPGDVLKRRLLDQSRSRVDESLEEIQEHLDVDHATAMAMAVQTGCSVKIIQNDIVEKAGKELARVFH